MTQLPSPPNSGQPVPVLGVTGGPPVFAGQISNDPNDGTVVIAPNPGNVTQFRKGTIPQAIQIYETFTNNTNYIRLGLYATIGGPFRIVTENSGSGVARPLQLESALAINIRSANQNILIVDGTASANVVLTGTTDDNIIYAFQILNHSRTANNFLVRNDGQVTLAAGVLISTPLVGTTLINTTTINGTLRVPAGGIVDFSGSTNVNPNLTNALANGTSVAIGGGVWVDVPSTSITLVGGTYFIFVESSITAGAAAVGTAVGLATAANALVMASLGQTTIPATNVQNNNSCAIVALSAGTYHVQAFSSAAATANSSKVTAFRIA
jgi:hypothetical protein